MIILFFQFCKEPFKCPPLHMCQRRRFFFSWFFNVHCLFRNLNLFRRLYYVYFMFCFILFFLKFRAGDVFQSPTPCGYSLLPRGRVFLFSRTCHPDLAGGISALVLSPCLRGTRGLPRRGCRSRYVFSSGHGMPCPYGGRLHYVFPVPRAL